MIVGGIDEAGRGCIVGPLVAAGVAIDEDVLSSWKRIGVKDSKKLSKKRREYLFSRVNRLPHAVALAMPAEIDAAVTSVIKTRKLNYLEAVKFAQIADSIKTIRLYVDAPDTNANRFGNVVYNLSTSKPEVISRHHADRDYVVVGAASIIAKVTRDRIIEDMHRQYGDFGSGYPSDARTRIFLTEYAKINGIPDWCRKSWSSWNRWLKS